MDKYPLTQYIKGRRVWLASNHEIVNVICIYIFHTCSWYCCCYCNYLFIYLFFILFKHLSSSMQSSDKETKYCTQKRTRTQSTVHWNIMPIAKVGIVYSLLACALKCIKFTLYCLSSSLISTASLPFSCDWHHHKKSSSSRYVSRVEWITFIVESICSASMYWHSTWWLCIVDKM